eukprot:2659378-Pyramimonas_sp.AAC.1
MTRLPADVREDLRGGWASSCAMSDSPFLLSLLGVGECRVPGAAIQNSGSNSVAVSAQKLQTVSGTRLRD